MSRDHTPDPRTNRRTFLKTTGALSVVTLGGLAGCSGDGGSDGSDGGSDGSDGDGNGGSTGGTDTEAGSGDAADLREEYGLAELDYETEDRLNIFQWGDYWPDDTIGIFEDVYGVTVNVSNYASNEEMFNKLKSGGTDQYDLIFPSDYMVNILHGQEMIQALDMSKIPAAGNLSSRFTEAPYDPGEDRYSMPYQWGTSGIGYNSDMIGDVDITSWEALWNSEWEGQITMLDDMREAMAVALKQLGYSLNTKEESEIMEARDRLIEQKDLLKSHDSSNFQTNLINEQASPLHGWSGGIFQAYWETFEDDSSPINYVVPEEGSVVWVDTAAVTVDAKNPNAAHAFINYVTNAQIAAKITNYTYYGSPNAAAEEYISDDVLSNESIYPDEETMQNLEFIKDLGDATTLYSEAWTEVKNA